MVQRFTVTLFFFQSVYAKVNSHTSKRCASSSPATAPPHKSPRTSLHAGEEHSKTDQQETQTENTEVPLCPSGSPIERRKSWRRATITRRSLPALPNPYQGEMSVLPLVISTE